MLEALSKVVEFAFRTIGVHQIEAVSHIHNLGSMNLLQKSFFLQLDTTETDPNLVRYYLKNPADSENANPG